jgi:elongation factor Ts
MTQITAQMVKDLREKTGAGMMDCKKALAETGSFEAAVDYLREKGLAAAQKKSGRVASEGTVAICVKDNAAAMVELNCETDFVARNHEFQKLADDVAAQVIRSMRTVVKAGESQVNLDLLGAEKFPDAGKTVTESVNEKVATIGEKITVRRAVLMNQGNAHGAYVHAGGSIGAVVELKVAEPAKATSDVVKQLAKDLAMHVAAANPGFLTRDKVDSTTIEHEKHIFRQQMLEMKKPENVLQKIIEGKMEKFFEDNCFVEQKFIKDPDQSINKIMSQAASAAGTSIAIVGYVRFKVGEGLEKKADDFASEVAKMVGTN